MRDPETAVAVHSRGDSGREEGGHLRKPDAI